MTHPDDTQEYLKKLNGLTLLCVGDVMLDEFVYGTVTRISPEAPVPVLRADRVVRAAGGAGNVAANLCALGCAVRLVGVAGDDAAAARLQDVLTGCAKLDAHLVGDAARPTICKTRYVAGAQHMLRVDAESTAPLSPDIEKNLLTQALAAMDGCAGVLLSDYAKGVLTPHVLRTLIDAARARGVPVLVDPKGHDYARYRGADVVTPNRRELAEATGNMPTVTDTDIEAAASRLLSDAGVDAVVATRSEQGLSVVARGQTARHMPTRARTVYDVSGAGDTVAAVTLAMLAAGAALPDAAALANTAAGLVVEKTGTASVMADELQAALERENATARGRTLAPVLGWTQAREQVANWKAQGLSVGFTNGCFDIVHQGHVVMLDACRAQCDRLVLGLNADASVRRLKGPTRPVNGQDARALVMAALGSVDAVVLFGDTVEEGDTPLDLIKSLRPDMIFKGQDYTVATVIGADFVQSYGGRVVLVPLEAGFSTTATIKKLGSAA